MKTRGAALAALTALYNRDPTALEQTFQHLTPTSLDRLDGWMSQEQETPDAVASNLVLAQAMIRRMVHRQLDKYATIATPNEVEAALKHHTLPVGLQQELSAKYGGSPPTTWWDALEQLRVISGDDLMELWTLILDHPMTTYVPMQCHDCGHIVPDAMSNDEDEDDAAIGLSEAEPTKEDIVMGIRGGWFRGRPRGTKILNLHCPECHATTRWYRSGHPQIILNPHRWGRLCGEQEDLRLALANYLGIQVRSCVPLDWDHIWSEFGIGVDGREWFVHDDSARNFAVRLDEGIGAWTGVFAIHPDPALCEDVTDEYLRCADVDGRADSCHKSKMPHYRKLVGKARHDGSGKGTQAKTVAGYVLHRAELSSDDITLEIRRAAQGLGIRSWSQ